MNNEGNENTQGGFWKKHWQKVKGLSSQVSSVWKVFDFIKNYPIYIALVMTAGTAVLGVFEWVHYKIAVIINYFPVVLFFILSTYKFFKRKSTKEYKLRIKLSILYKDLKNTKSVYTAKNIYQEIIAITPEKDKDILYLNELDLADNGIHEQYINRVDGLLMLPEYNL